VGATQTKGLGLNDECIHGLEDQRCDQCFPKAAPVIVPGASAVSTASKRPSRAREATAPTTLRTARVVVAKSAAPARSTAAPKSSAKAGTDVGEQRIYHVTHISNLAGILETGALLADASEAWGARPAVDISSADTRESRRATLVAGEASLSVARYVPFFLSPNASVWDSIRAQVADPRLELDAHGSAPYDFVILVSTVKKVRDARASESESAAVVTDGDAAGVLTRFGTTGEDAQRMVRKLRADKESEAILEAEFLVEEAFPYELVTLIGVANDRVRDAVKPILAASAHRPKLAVYPPWFQATEETTE
jgi:hypothetical protein